MKPVIYNITRVFISMVYLLITTYQVHAQWATNPVINNGISKAAYQQLYPNIVSDGAGGAIIVWQDKRNGVNYDIYAQRINSSGVVQWTSNGVAICDVVNDQTSPKIISDEAGGAIISWEDNYSGTRDIYAQKINASGIVQWTQNGVAICTAVNTQWELDLVGDGSGGAIITWVDNRSGVFPDMSINVQRINASGVVQWAANGVPICTGLFSKFYPVIVGDDSGGAIIAWQDYRLGGFYNIFAQKINASGNVQWDSNGVALCPTTFAQENPVIVSNGSGGAIITWQDYRTTTNWGIYAQMIHSSGMITWDPEGVEICDVVKNQESPQIISDGSGGAIITWQDYRSGTSLDIYAQKLNSSGSAQWTLDGVSLCTESGTAYNQTVAGDGAGGAIITWQDLRSNASYDIYAQKINTLGAAQWTSNGIVISTAWSNQDIPAIVSDGSGGAIITWQDYRSGSSYDIYTQKIDKYGLLGQAAPKLVAAKDIANDQGGRMRLFWDPSYLDADTALTVKSYTVKLGAKSKGIIGKTTGTSGNGIYWQTSDIVRADQSEGYSSVVATYADSGLQGIPMYYFQVIAKNSDSTQSWYSNIDSGYSVDNIPPVGIGNAIIASNGGGIQLKWEKNRVDKDLMGYVIYRDTVSGFSLNKIKKLAQTIDTIFVDTLTTYGKTYYYKIASIDIHGNVGAPSVELNQKVLSVRTTRGVAPIIFALEQNYPNPFNPTTTIEFTVPSNGHATLKIFNAIGQEIATLFNGEAEAGKYHQVQFSARGQASGLYFSRLEYNGKVQLKKMSFIK